MKSQAYQLLKNKCDSRNTNSDTQCLWGQTAAPAAAAPCQGEGWSSPDCGLLLMKGSCTTSAPLNMI